MMPFHFAKRHITEFTDTSNVIESFFKIFGVAQSDDRQVLVTFQK
jgi:hypothetical protein